MGVYISPKDTTKEQWLHENGKEISVHEFSTTSFAQADSNGERLVVLVDNGTFRAAGIMFFQTELDYWRQDNSGRPKKYYRVKTELLMNLKVSSLAKYT